MALTDNLISYYALESNGNDSLGTNNMTESNTSYVTGKIGNAVSFNWSTSEMRNGNITLPAWNSPYSMNFWVKLNAEISSSFWWLAMLAPDGTNQDTQYSMNYQYNWWTRRLALEHYYNWPETYYPLYHNVTLGTSNWNMITMTYSWSVINIYFNWTLVTTWWWTGTYWSSWPQTYQKGITIWSLYFLSAYWNRSNAIIDEFWYCNREITSTEISTLYNSWSWLAYPFSTWATFIPKITFL